MAFADFIVTDFGAQWLAQAVEDAAQGTQKAVLTAMRFGLGTVAETPTMQTLWHEDTTSLEVWSGGNAIGIRGIASNLGDTAAHDLDFIEVTGTNDGTSGTICFAKSEEVESIPPASEQQIARTATVSLAVSGDAAVTLATPQTGYAIEESTLKKAPLVNDGAILLGDGAGESCAVYYDTGNLRIGRSVTTAGDGTFFGSVNAASADITNRLNAGSVWATNCVLSGTLTADKALVSGVFGGENAVARAGNVPRLAVKKTGGFTVWRDGAKVEGIALANVWTQLHVPADAAGVALIGKTDGSVTCLPFDSGAFPRLGPDDFTFLAVFCA